MRDTERVRWAATVEQLRVRRTQLVGDTFVAASFVAAAGSARVFVSVVFKRPST